MSSFTDQLLMQLRKKEVWAFHYEKGEDARIYYFKTARQMMGGYYNHYAIYGIRPKDITFAKIIMFEGEPRVATLTTEMIREAHKAALGKPFW